MARSARFTICSVFMVLIFTSLMVKGAAYGVVDDSFGWGFPRGPSLELQQQKIQSFLDNTNITCDFEEGWGGGDHGTGQLGQVSAVSVDDAGRVLVFHRGDRVWDGSSFDENNIYIGPQHPITTPTVLVMADNGTVLHSWGDHMFYMPHGLTAAGEDVWVTDVALHQVFKFSTKDTTRPLVTIGTRLEPGEDEHHLCKPTSVAVLDNGDFFVADGYCNSRILKFDRMGRLILQFGRRPSPGERVGGGDRYSLLIPHALALGGGAVCAADREHARVACFRAADGTFLSQYTSWLFGAQLFSVAYSDKHGGTLYVVTGATAAGALGFEISYESGKVVGWFATAGGLRAPHDLAVGRDGSVYVAELGRRLLKFKSSAARASPAPPPPRARPAPPLPRAPALTATKDSDETPAAAVAGGAAGRSAAVSVVGVSVCVALAAGVLLARRRARHRRERPRGFEPLRNTDSDDETAPALPAPLV